MSDLNKPAIAAVVGATATGKTAVGVELALTLDGEVVNADSRLFYRGMDVATAKPTTDEMQGVPHHLIDILDPDSEFSLAGYLKRARAAILEISGRGKFPIVVGGSGQYVWALLEGWEVPEIEPDTELRAELEDLLTKQGVSALADRLKAISSDVANETDLLNPRRLIRAIERIESNGSEIPESRSKPSEAPYDAFIVGLMVERSVLHERILERIKSMSDNGWKEEVRSLLNIGYSTQDRALSGIGYKQMIGHIVGEYDLPEATRLTAVATNRLVRQQNNWFQQDDPRINWFDMTRETSQMVKSIVKTAKLRQENRRQLHY
jgi:tRNA dimethylallyltransferase